MKLTKHLFNEINALKAKLSKAEQETETLQQELLANSNALKQKQEKIDQLAKQGRLQKQLKALQKDYDQVKLESQNLRKQLSDSQNNLTQLRGVAANVENNTALSGNSFKGRYFALIIGINDYQDPGLNPLKTAVNDARGIGQVLKQKYGFQTTLITDNQATKDGIYEALVKINEMMNEDDNFLIYYAGHGSKEKNSFHWIPSDAKQSNEWSMISTDDITRQIDPKSMKAKHVLIIADSCFAGLLAVETRSSIIDTLALGDKLGWINKKYGLVSRNLLASGGDEPVLDAESQNGQSIFANALVELLAEHDGIISANDIYQSIGSKVESFARSRALSQAPVYRPLSGDKFGEFFFIPRNLQRVAETQKEQSRKFSITAMSDQKSLETYISVDF